MKKMAYVGIIERENTITIDGYSACKTLRGAIRDLGMYIERELGYKGYEDCMNPENKEEAEAMLVKPEISCGGWFLDAEEVECACQYNEETDEMEYKDGYNFYVVCRFVK